MALVANPIIRFAYFVRGLFVPLLKIVLGLTLVALGVWRCEDVLIKVHRLTFHGGTMVAVLALTGAMIITAFGLVVTASAGSKAIKQIRRMTKTEAGVAMLVLGFGAFALVLVMLHGDWRVGGAVFALLVADIGVVNIIDSYLKGRPRKSY